MPHPDCPEERCESCTYLQSYTPAERKEFIDPQIIGECRYNAPHIMFEGKAIQPAVTVGYWCGKWLPSKSFAKEHKWASEDARIVALKNHIATIKQKD